MNIIETERFGMHAERRLQARMSQAGMKPGKLIPGGIGEFLDASFDLHAGDATSRDFADLLLAIDEAMSDVEEAKPVEPLEAPRFERRSVGSRSRPWLRFLPAAAKPTHPHVVEPGISELHPSKDGSGGYDVVIRKPGVVDGEGVRTDGERREGLRVFARYSEAI